MTSPNTIIADLTAEVESLRKQRDELLESCKKYRKQVQLGFKHLIETPVLSDKEIDDGYTAFEHLRTALVCAIDKKEKAERQYSELLSDNQKKSTNKFTGPVTDDDCLHMANESNFAQERD